MSAPVKRSRTMRESEAWVEVARRIDAAFHDGRWRGLYAVSSEVFGGAWYIQAYRRLAVHDQPDRAYDASSSEDLVLAALFLALESSDEEQSSRRSARREARGA